MTEPFNLAVTATRFLGVIHATVYAVLPDGCHDAAVTDIYPGGNVQYVVDPGTAQVFVRFTRRDGPCTQGLRPWRATREIRDAYHDTLEAIGEFEDRTFVISVPVYDFKLAGGPDIDPGFDPESIVEAFIVLALSETSEDVRHIGCRIVPKDAIYPAIYSRVFGPASLAQCRAWLNGHCVVFDQADPAGDG
jgi:hypothetical protein